MTDLLATLQAHPLFGLSVTFVAYAVAMAVWRWLDQPAVLHPVLVATLIVAMMLMATRMDYASYLDQTQILTEALGLVVVLLAVPLYRQFHRIREAATPIALALTIGSVMALATALALPALGGASRELLATLAPKSATTTVAVQIAEHLGGAAGITAVVVISTGIFGAVFGPAILSALGVRDHRAQGFALGVASHAIGTARAFQISDTAGAFAGLGMVLNGLLTIALAPMVLALLDR